MLGAVSCRLMMPYPVWSLTHLVHLSDLTICGSRVNEVMSQLLQSSAAPVLPASLQMLRLDSLEALRFQSVPR